MLAHDDSSSLFLDHIPLLAIFTFSVTYSQISWNAVFVSTEPDPIRSWFGWQKNCISTHPIMQL